MGGGVAVLGRAQAWGSPSVRMLGFYDLRVNEQHGLRVRLTQRPQTWGSGLPAGSAAIAWVGGSETVRAQIGLAWPMART